MPYGHHLIAEYATGYTLDQRSLDDRNPFGEGNTWTAIVQEIPTRAGHGPLIRLALFPDSGGEGIVADWIWIVDHYPGAVPIYEREMMATISTPGIEPTVRCMYHRFGFTYIDDGEVIDMTEIVTVKV